MTHTLESTVEHLDRGPLDRDELAAIVARVSGYPIDLNLPVVQVEAALKVTR